MKTQFVTNEKGTKIAALVPIKKYEQLIENLHDLEIVALRRNDERVPFEEVKRKLIADAILPKWSMCSQPTTAKNFTAEMTTFPAISLPSDPSRKQAARTVKLRDMPPPNKIAL